MKLMTGRRSTFLPGIRAGPVTYARRVTDGVRGLFTTRSLRRGALLLDVPRRYCYLPRGLASATLVVPDAPQAYTRYCRQLRRLNRGVTLFPESWLWMQRLSSDVKENGVSLSAHVSLDEMDQTLARGKSVVSITLTPVEAALAVSAALRFFYPEVAHLSAEVCASLSLGPSPSPVSDAFVSSLPFHQFLAAGVEELFVGSGQVEANAHAGLEQIASNLRDAVMTHASHQEYALLEDQAELLDEILLTAIYITRARCLPVRLLAQASQPASDAVVSVFAAGLDGLNHAGQRHTAEAAIHGPGVVVRASRDLRCGEEITLDYQLQLPMGGPRGAAAGATAHMTHQLVADHWREGRYMLNMQQDA